MVPRSLNNHEFGLRLLERLGDEGNIFLSPSSIEMALAMTARGAKGYTRLQMTDVLWGEKLTDQEISEYLSFTKSALQSQKVVISIANRLFAQKDYPFVQDYIDALSNFGGLDTLPFHSDPDGSRQIINRWVEEQTRRKIQNLLPPGSIDHLTRLVIANAIYFYGAWDFAFDKKNTRDGAFYTRGSQFVSVPMMRQTLKLFHVDMQSMQVLALPYSDPDYSLVTFLPKRSIEEAFREITFEGLSNILDWISPKKVDVVLPSFEIRWGTKNLKEVLFALGMEYVFGSEADLTGMSQIDGDLYVSGVFHQAYVKVNEEGTEAAAATAVVTKSRSIELDPIEVIHDHPFLFAIVDRKTQSVLFLGKIVDPTKKE